MALTPSSGSGIVAVVAVHRVVIPVYPGIQPLDVVGPHEVLVGASAAADHLGRPGPRYSVEVVAAVPGPVRGDSGLALHATALPDPARPTGTLLLPGGDAARSTAIDDEALVRWIRTAAAMSDRVATVCSGTFLAAAAGLCDGKRVTTHWSRAGQLAAACPAATVEPDAIYIRDGALWTSAGVTAGIDLALALVEDDLGADVAQLVARHLVVPLRRAGGQSQFAAPVWSDPPGPGPIRQAKDLVDADPAGDHTVTSLAAAVALSPRHFTRLFRQQVGEPPARYVERIRVESARRALEVEQAGLDEIARRCGFGTAETLRRSFHRRLGLSPDAYRRRFATPA
jgi:transcriptional regulator GlxA family with amidase domain